MRKPGWSVLMAVSSVQSGSVPLARVNEGLRLTVASVLAVAVDSSAAQAGVAREIGRAGACAGRAAGWRLAAAHADLRLEAALLQDLLLGRPLGRLGRRLCLRFGLGLGTGHALGQLEAPGAFDEAQFRLGRLGQGDVEVGRGIGALLLFELGNGLFLAREKARQLERAVGEHAHGQQRDAGNHDLLPRRLRRPPVHEFAALLLWLRRCGIGVVGACVHRDSSLLTERLTLSLAVPVGLCCTAAAGDLLVMPDTRLPRRSRMREATWWITIVSPSTWKSAMASVPSDSMTKAAGMALAALKVM